MIIQPHTKKQRVRTPHIQELLWLLRSSERSHTHLDWQTEEEWLEHHQCHVTFDDTDLIAMLSVPVEPDNYTWIRLAAVKDKQCVTPTLTTLWIDAKTEVRRRGITSVAALTANVWPECIMPKWGFTPYGQVVVLRRDQTRKIPTTNTVISIRTASISDLQAILEIDHAAFEPLWRYSMRTLRLALMQAEFATVAYRGSDIVGYLMASQNNGKALLARLVVTPEYQHSGFGRALTLDMLRHFADGRASAVEVNTQEDNTASIALYRALDFQFTGEKAQVWRCMVN